MLAADSVIILQAEQMLAEYSRNLKRMEVRIRDAENRALEVTQQVRI